MGLENTTPKVKCPSCKSDNTKFVEKRKHNGVFGPGGYSYVTDSFYSCLNCGIRFDKI